MTRFRPIQSAQPPLNGELPQASGNTVQPDQVNTVSWPGFYILAEIPSQNVTEKGRSWLGRAAKTKARRNLWRILCASGMAQVRIPAATGPRLVHIVAYRRQRCKDIANLIGGAKACVDGMVDAGLMLDDQDSKARITYQQDVASASPTRQPCTLIRVHNITPSQPDTKENTSP